MKDHFENDCMQLLIERARHGAVDRRTFIKAMGFLAAVPLAMRTRMAWADDRLVIVNWGGDAIDAYEKAWTKSFSRETGIEVKIDGSGPTRGAIKSQAEGGNIGWDVVDADPFTARNLGDEGILRPIDYDVVDRSRIREGMDYKYGAPSYLYSYVLAYDSAIYGDDGPKTWADFWDTDRFPEQRTLYKWLNGVMEAALLADGVDVEDLYPIDVPRAMEKIDELKPYVLSFWGSGAESQNLMLSGETSMGMVWSTRAMRMTEDSNGRIQWSYNNAFVNPSVWAVLENNPAGAQPAMEFIAHAQDPESQAVLFEELGNGPANPAADKLIPAGKRYLNCASPENLRKQIVLDVEWYADHYAESLEKYLDRIAA